MRLYELNISTFTPSPRGIPRLKISHALIRSAQSPTDFTSPMIYFTRQSQAASRGMVSNPKIVKEGPNT